MQKHCIGNLFFSFFKIFLLLHSFCTPIKDFCPIYNTMALLQISNNMEFKEETAYLESAYRIGNSPYIEILQTTATARISHRRTKDARTYTRHTPGSHEPRTLSLWISRRDTPSSHTFKTSIAPASLSYGRFKSKRTTTAHERSAL